MKKLVCFMLAFVFILGIIPIETKADEAVKDTLEQALYIIPNGFTEPEIFSDKTSPSVVTVKEAEEKLAELIEKLEGKYFTVNGTYCSSSGVHATKCDNCLMSNVIAEKWLEEVVGMVPLNVSLCPTQYSYSGKQGSADGWQCFGFANFAHWYIFAEKNTDKVYSTLEITGPMTYETIKNALPGDVIRTNYYGGHSMVFISCDENGFTVLDSNFSTTYSCRVKVHQMKYNENYTVAVTGTENYDRKSKTEDYIKGDINQNGLVEIDDVYCARLSAAKLLTLSEEQIAAGDVDSDGKITAIDANIIRKYILKIIEKFPEN